METRHLLQPYPNKSSCTDTLAPQINKHTPKKKRKKKKERKKKIIGQLQWEGQKELVRPVPNDSSVARLSNMTASGAHTLWSNTGTLKK